MFGARPIQFSLETKNGLLPIRGFRPVLFCVQGIRTTLLLKLGYLSDELLVLILQLAESGIDALTFSNLLPVGLAGLLQLIAQILDGFLPFGQLPFPFLRSGFELTASRLEL